jgi:hypothetical protein
MAHLIRIVLFNLAVAGLLLALLEGAVRLVVPDIIPVGTDRHLVRDRVYDDAPGLQPDAEGRSNGALFRVDGEGFWRYATERDPALPAWLFLCDSVTMGIGVDPDSTFAGRLAANLKDVRILNPSWIGYSVQHYRALLDVMLNEEPREGGAIERVTVFWCLNDLYGALPALQDPNQTVRRVGGRLLSLARAEFRTYHWLKARLLDRPRSYYLHDLNLYTHDALPVALSDLREMAARCDERGIAFDIVVLPYAYQFRAEDEAKAFLPQRVMHHQLDALSVHDPAPFLTAHALDPASLYLFGDGIHFNAQGHALLASYLLDRLR